MEADHSSAISALRLIGFGLLAFAITTVAGGVWSALLVTNFQTTPAMPWSVPAMAVLLWLAWSYLGGKGPPRSTSEARHRYLRANSVPAPTYLWAWIAGGLSLFAFSGYWIVLSQVVKMPPNTFSDLSAYPRATLALMILMGSLVSPFMEEAGFRGYFQVALERRFRAPVAIIVSSLVFALAHGPTQGFVWPKLLFYFLVGVAFGTTAYLTHSILPAIPVHFVGLLLFFTLIWPRDATRRLVWNGGPDNWFWIHLGQSILSTALAFWAFQRLARVRIHVSPAAATDVARSQTA